MTTETKIAKITDVDIELICLLGMPNKVVSEYLHISPDAVNTRIVRLANKFEVENRTAIVVKALRLGLVNIYQLSYRSAW